MYKTIYNNNNVYLYSNITTNNLKCNEIVTKSVIYRL